MLIAACVALIFGIAFWYLLFGAELALNGARMDKWVHFRCLWEELLWALPGGWKKRLDYCDGDVELAKTLPGIRNFIFMHFLVPFGPMLLVILLWR